MTTNEAFALLSPNLTPNASLATARKLYLEKARTAHPDAGGTMAQFTELAQAYKMVQAAIKQPRKCPACDGRGHTVKFVRGVPGPRKGCPTCQGTGLVRTTE